MIQSKIRIVFVFLNISIIIDREGVHYELSNLEVNKNRTWFRHS